MRIASRIIALSVAAIVLGACAHDASKPATVKAECAVFTDPGYHVQGKTRRDQFWIDSQLESGYASCSWSRPGGAKPGAKRKSGKK